MSSVAVIIPTLNEEKAIGKVLDNMPETVCNLDLKAYVIDGGSEDRTREIVKESNAELLEQSYRGGKGAAMRESLDKVEADIYVFIDGDMTYPLEEMDKLVRPVKNGEADHVMGSRFEEREDGAFKYRNFYGNKMLGWFYRKLTDSEIEDFLTGYRAISDDLAKELDLETDGFEIETEITFKTLELGKEVEEVDITYRPRLGESKLDFKKEGLKIPVYGLKLGLNLG